MRLQVVHALCECMDKELRELGLARCATLSRLPPAGGCSCQPACCEAPL